MRKKGASGGVARRAQESKTWSSFNAYTTAALKARGDPECDPISRAFGQWAGQAGGSVVGFAIDDQVLAARVCEATGPLEKLAWNSTRGGRSLSRFDKRLEGLPSVVHLDGADLGICGAKQCFSVCPPTVGDDGKRRQGHGGVWEIAKLPDSIVGPVSHERKGTHRCPYFPDGVSRYAEAALRYEAASVASAKVGSRNRSLNKAAYVLARFICCRALSRE